MGRSDKCHRESDPTSPCLRSSLINYLIWELALSAISQMPRTSTGNLDGGCHCVRWEALGPAAGGRRPRSRGAATKLRGESRRVERLRNKNKKPPQGRRGPEAMPGHCLRQQRQAGPLQLPPRPRGLPLVSGALWAVAPHCQPRLVALVLPLVDWFSQLRPRSQEGRQAGGKLSDTDPVLRVPRVVGLEPGRDPAGRAGAEWTSEDLAPVSGSAWLRTLL